MIGKPGRSNCPNWRGQDFVFEPNETKDVSDLCGRWLITQFGYYGLVSLPDKNIVTEKEEYDTAISKLREHGIQQLYKWSIRVIDQYREEAKKCVDARERPPRPNEFVKTASKVSKCYHEEMLLSDKETIEEHNLMREILGTVEHDSDKLLERTLQKELDDADKNSRQYSNQDKPVKIAEPKEPQEPKPDTGKHVHNKKNKKNKGGTPRSNNKSTVESTMENMQPLDLKDNAYKG